MAAIHPLTSSAAIPLVYRNLNLHPLTVHPPATLNRYHDLMERCLTSGNVHAHYIRGILQYFENNNPDGGLPHLFLKEGLPHLRIAAEGSYNNAIYLYGLVKLCSGEPAIGRAMIDSLAWREKKARVDRC